MSRINHCSLQGAMHRGEREGRTDARLGVDSPGALKNGFAPAGCCSYADLKAEADLRPPGRGSTRQISDHRLGVVATK